VRWHLAATASPEASTVAPAATSGATLAGLMSCTTSSNPALTRLSAIGPGSRSFWFAAEFASPRSACRAAVLVERGKRLVEKQDTRLHRQRPGQGHTLLLPTGQLARIACRQGAEPHELEHFSHSRSLGRPPDPAGGKPVRNILRYRHVREQGIVLKNNTDFLAIGRQFVDRLAGDHHPSHCLGDKAGDDPQQCSLAASRRTQQGEQLAAADLKRYVVNREPGAVAMGYRVENEIAA
jgi:hypothetical protein